MTILWFRRDLRIRDSFLLSLAKSEILPIFIFDPNILYELTPEDRRVSYIFDSVLELKRDLKKVGLDLAIFYGKPKMVFEFLLGLGAKKVICSVDYDSYAIARDKEIESIIELHRINDSFLFEPSTILTNKLKPYKVFTPYYKIALEHLQNIDISKKKLPHSPIILNRSLDFEHILKIEWTLKRVPIEINSIGFEYNPPNLPKALEALEIFLPKLANYNTDRDVLDINGCSKLGVYLRFGTLGIRELVRTVLAQRYSKGREVFIRELIWREFYAQLLANFPQTSEKNFNQKNIAYENKKEFIERFCSATTGVPIVDASINQLKKTGYMHNRARMICASFLTKHLGVDWRIGERFFRRYLLDYEASSNIGSWQWCAGVGADAQPYFRIFNPYLQASKYDPFGNYIKKWLPALKNYDQKALHSESFLLNTNIPNYPKPIVVHKVAREEALKREQKADNSLVQRDSPLLFN